MESEGEFVSIVISQTKKIYASSKKRFASGSLKVKPLRLSTFFLVLLVPTKTNTRIMPRVFSMSLSRSSLALLFLFSSVPYTAVSLRVNGDTTASAAGMESRTLDATQEQPAAQEGMGEQSLLAPAEHDSMADISTPAVRDGGFLTNEFSRDDADEYAPEMTFSEINEVFLQSRFAKVALKTLFIALVNYGWDADYVRNTFINTIGRGSGGEIGYSQWVSVVTALTRLQSGTEKSEKTYTEIAALFQKDHAAKVSLKEFSDACVKYGYAAERVRNTFSDTIGRASGGEIGYSEWVRVVTAFAQQVMG